MKSLGITFTFSWSLALGQSLTSLLDVPPYNPNPGELSGAALNPQFNGPREVTIFNPKLLARNKKRSTTVVPQPSTGLASAIYTMANIPDNDNFVFSYNLFSNGTIDGSSVQVNNFSNQTTMSAAVLMNVTDSRADVAGARFKSSPSVYQDALHSQGSMIQAGSRLFTVNPGSNSFTAFAINCSAPNQLIELGTATVNGEFPNTLAVAIENQVVCVGTSGRDAGIECFTADAGFGTINPPQYFSGTNVSLPLPIQQADGTPTGPPDTLSQLLFTDDEKLLIAVVKGAADSGGNIISPGFINVYPISSQGLGQPVQSTPTNTKFLSGCTFQYNTYKLFCADRGVGTLAMTIDSSSLLVSVSGMTPASQINPTSMNGWTARSPFSNGPWYDTAVNENYIAAFKQGSGSYLTTHNFTNSNPNLIEMATANSFVYALTFGIGDSDGHVTDGSSAPTAPPQVTIARDLNLAGQFQVEQVFALQKWDATYEGMAVFIPSDESNICDFS